MSLSAELRQDLQALARKHGSFVLVAGCAELLRELATRGVEEILADRAREKSGEQQPCPRCARRDAAIREMEETLKRTTTTRPIGGADPDSKED